MASNQNFGHEKSDPEKPKNLPSTTSLLAQSNLAWSQPSGFVLSQPAPVETKQPTSQENTSTDQPVGSPINTDETSDQSSQQNNTASNPSGFSLPPEPKSSPSSTQPNTPTEPYKEVNYHWFYQKDPEQHPDEWQAFSVLDSYHLETAFRQSRLDDLIPTNGTRFDVRLRDRTRTPVYWQGPATPVQRCSWFYKRETDYRFIPYSEEISELLESTYRECSLNNQWNRRLDLTNTEFMVFYAYNSVYHYFSEPVQSPSSGWSALMTSDPGSQPRYAYRGPGLIQCEPERDESLTSVQHLIFFVHGIGEFCDLSFRPLKDVVDDFRNITHDLVQTHYGPTENRVEVLPISWHWALHTKQLDERLQEITLPSITRLRSFTNDTILDALFYTSPMHSNALLNFVATEINRLYAIFLQRNPYFGGRIALAGHSLGSLILFDLLSYQKPPEYNQQPLDSVQKQQVQVEQIHFRPECLFAMGSPLAAFLTVRGIQLDQNFRLPTCPAFYNIFHPYDPIAYRLEPLINREFVKLKPVLIPHHKGRKRIHLELKDSIQRVGTDLKQKLMTGLKGALSSIYGFARAHYEEPNESEQIMIQQQMSTESEPAGTNDVVCEQSQTLENSESSLPHSSSVPTSLADLAASPDISQAELSRIISMDFGRLNRGRRLDYVLQERPYEIMNEYVFAITSHACYWASEDTSLLMLRELFGQSTTVAQQQSSMIVQNE